MFNNNNQSTNVTFSYIADTMGKSYNLKSSDQQNDNVYDNAAFDDSQQQNGHYKVRTEIPM